MNLNNHLAQSLHKSYRDQSHVMSVLCHITPTNQQYSSVLPSTLPQHPCR